MSSMNGGLSAASEKDLADLVVNIVKEEPALTRLDLSGFSSENSEHGTQILAALRASTSYALNSLNLSSNPAWWSANSENLTALIRIINNQEQL